MFRHLLFSGFPWNLNYTVCPILLAVTTSLFSFLSLTQRAQYNPRRNHISNLSLPPTPTVLIFYLVGRDAGLSPTCFCWFHNDCSLHTLLSKSLSIHQSLGWGPWSSVQWYIELQNCSYHFSFSYFLWRTSRTEILSRFLYALVSMSNSPALLQEWSAKNQPMIEMTHLALLLEKYSTPKYSPLLGVVTLYPSRELETLVPLPKSWINFHLLYFYYNLFI